MSKGSKRRPTSPAFKKNFDNIKWSGNESRFIRPKKSRPKTHHIMPDIEPYQAVAGEETGQWITSRSKEREYLRKNDFQQVGNEWNYFSKYHGKTPNNPTREWQK